VGASTAAAQPTPIKVGDTLEFTAVVINKGIGAADAFSVELKDSAGAISQSVLGLAANEEKDLKFTRKLSKETETFIFTIDPDKKINDSDRNNNVFKLEVRAEAAPPEVQEYALIYSPNLSTCPSVLAVKPGKIRLLNTALSGSMSELTIREATTKQTLFGLQPFSVESGKLTTVEFVLDKPGEYEIVQGQTVVGKLTTQFKEEVFEVGLIYSAKELKTVPATAFARKGKLRICNTALDASLSKLSIRDASTKQPLFGLSEFEVSPGKLTKLELVIDKAGEYEIVQGQNVLGKLIVAD